MALQFRPAVRRRAPLLISVSGTSGSGKTLSALLLAAGLAKGRGRVAMIDTENGRGEMYADSPLIKAAFPDGYDYAEITAPFSPARYIEAISACEEAGKVVCVIDSTTHEWEGVGGCCEIAEKNKLRNMDNWGMAKREHKRFVNHCLASSMDIIFCLRARDKVKIEKVGGKQEVIPIGIQPICEKNFVFEMMLSLLMNEETKHANPIKCPEALLPRFQKPHLITPEDGEFIATWNGGAAVIDPYEQLRKRARLAAECGMDAYRKFFGGISKADSKRLVDSGDHDGFKFEAQEADKLNEAGSLEQAATNA